MARSQRVPGHTDADAGELRRDGRRRRRRELPERAPRCVLVPGQLVARPIDLRYCADVGAQRGALGLLHLTQPVPSNGCR